MVPKSTVILTQRRCPGTAWRCLGIPAEVRLLLTQGIARVQHLEQASQARGGLGIIEGGDLEHS